MSHWAQAYIGKPWVGGAAGPDAYDCHGIVRAVYSDQLGIVLPHVACNPDSTLSVVRAMRGYDYSTWCEVPAPRHEFDVVEMSQDRMPHHVGIYLRLDGGGVLTSVQGVGVIYQSLTSLARHGWAITNVYRRRP